MTSRSSAMQVEADRRQAPDGPSAIDFAHLRKFTLGARDLELEVLHLFADQAPLYLDQLRDAETATAWKQATHALKGSAMAIGAHDVAKLAAAAERSDDWQSTAARQRIAEALGEALGHVEAALAAFEHGIIAQPPSASAA